MTARQVYWGRGVYVVQGIILWGWVAVVNVDPIIIWVGWGCFNVGHIRLLNYCVHILEILQNYVLIVWVAVVNVELRIILGRSCVNLYLRIILWRG